MRRGFSLLEAVVVLAICVTVLAVALPISLALLREQKGLASEVLRGDTFPLLHARLDRDLGNATGMSVAPDPELGGVTIALAPRTETEPQIVWSLSPGAIERREVPADGSAGPPAHTWTPAGTLDLDPLELASGRLGLWWRPAQGAAELLVFEGPRGAETVR